MHEPGVPLSHYPSHGVEAVILDCIAGGHHAEIPLAPLLARFGPDYGVRAIALHCRCSSCNSKSVESRPAWPTRDPTVRGRELPPGDSNRVARSADVLDYAQPK